MLKFIYNLYFRRFKTLWIDTKYIIIIRKLVNIIIPFYFKITYWFPGNRLFKNQTNEYIVSLTTFPTRIDKVWITIETILRQSVKPDSIIIWLYKGEFEGIASVPKNLLRLQKRGLQIKFCNENLKPHKKYYYTMKEYKYSNIITIDDDVFYPPDLIANLIINHNKYPKAISCTRCREIKIFDNQIRPYFEWKYVLTAQRPSFKYLPIGFGGVLYPVGSLNSEVFNINNIMELALNTDDLWLKIMSILNNTKVTCLPESDPRHYIPIINKKDKQLTENNLNDGNNDRVFRRLISKYNIQLSIFN